MLNNNKKIQIINKCRQKCLHLFFYKNNFENKIKKNIKKHLHLKKICIQYNKIEKNVKK